MLPLPRARLIAWAICCALAVLLLPSSAWGATTGLPPGSASFSRLAGSFMASSTSSPYSTAVMSDAPSAYYRLDESGVTLLGDSSGNAHVGAYYAAPTSAPGLVGDANPAVVVAAGGNLRGEVPAGAWMNTAAMTVEANLKTTGTGAIVGRDNGGGSRAFQFNVKATGKLEGIWWGPGGGPYFVNGSTAVNDGQAHDVAFVVGSGGAALYLDGVQDGSSTQTGGMVLSGPELTIGVNQSGGGCACQSPLIGTIDDVSLYPTALTSGRVASHASNRVAATSTTSPSPTPAPTTTVTVYPSPAPATYSGPACDDSAPCTYKPDTPTQAFLFLGFGLLVCCAGSVMVATWKR